ncbi:MAG: NTP transferase domain-containing protein [Deltaproteobacteria bacterium]|nr:NTP transferase domain-containing protein [Deltaproteobacteria bacterium]
MEAVILAGGKGKRLKPYTMVIPKPLLPLDNVPILEVVLSQLARAGVGRVVITLGHMTHLFVASIGDGSRWNIKVEYLREDDPRGTAGSLSMIPDLDDNFLVMNGDILTTIDYGALYDAHCRREAWGTLAVHRREVGIDYGVVEMGQSGVLNAYIEKPTIPYNVSMGINVLSKKCLGYIPPDQRFDMPDLMMSMKRDGRLILCYETDCYWQDIGRFDDYQKASADFAEDPSRFLGGNFKRPWL